MKKIVALWFFALYICFTSQSYAQLKHPLADILGVSTSSNLPDTIEGPGLILPHSNLYFLDTLKENFFLELTFAQDKKIDLYNAIVGERIAELKVEIEDNNPQGIDYSIAEMTTAISQARIEIDKLDRNGKLKPETAKKLNEYIKERYVYLGKLENILTGSLRSKVKAAMRSFLEDKIKLAAHLPSDIAKNESEIDLKSIREQNLEDLTASAKILQQALYKESDEKGKQENKEGQNQRKEVEKLLKDIESLSINYQKNETSQKVVNSKEKIILVPSIIPAE